MPSAHKGDLCLFDLMQITYERTDWVSWEDWLIRDAPEDDVIQQSDLFSQLHRWERFKTLCLRAVRLHTHTHTFRDKDIKTNDPKQKWDSEI